MKKRLFLLSCLASIGPFALAQSRYLVAYNEATAPLIPLVKAVYAEMGIAPVFELIPSERAINLTNSGQYDADLSRVEPTFSHYPNLIHSNEALKQTELYAYVLKQSSILLSEITQLGKYRLGYIRGSKLVENFLLENRFSAIYANSTDSFFNMFMAGRFDIALVTSTQLMLQREPIELVAKRIGPILDTRLSYHVFHKKHVDLLPKFDAVLRAMRRDGRLSVYLQAKP